MKRRTFIKTGALGLVATAGCLSSPSNRDDLPPASQVRENAVEVEYDDLLRNAEDYEGNSLHFPRAEVIQMIQGDDGDHFNFRLTVNAERDDIFATWEGDRFIEGDLVECWGVCFGAYTYETTFGNDRTIPGVDLVDIDLLEDG